MAPAKKRKIASSTSGGNTLLSYFASPNGSNSSSTRGGAAQSPSSHFKKVKLERREVSVSPLSPLSGKENRHLNAVAGGKEKGTREEPIEIPADDDDDEEAVEVLVKGERDGAPMDAETINCDGELNPDPPPPERASTADLVPPLDCTPPPAPILTAQAPGLTRAPSCVPQPGGAFFTLRDAPDMEMEMEMAFEPGEGDVWETGDDELAPGEEGTEFGGDDDRAVEEEEDGAEEGPEETGELGHPSGADVDGRGGEGGASAEGLGCPICGTVIADLAKLVRACFFVYSGRWFAKACWRTATARQRLPRLSPCGISISRSLSTITHAPCTERSALQALPLTAQAPLHPELLPSHPCPRPSPQPKRLQRPHVPKQRHARLGPG
ncbi:hypothetical protein CALCODRAFT_144669 [Calocera cornea HHB12733]|uniref:Uncharacterized protein n=1 Tax=Calocera cornea HHB12733 TaxID=1353952 RepID=A0A165CS90_9BASI|nr:hypothetical protein CALCODRAFT_144669 [Calocera cornea HHB12733]